MSVSGKKSHPAGWMFCVDCRRILVFGGRIETVYHTSHVWLDQQLGRCDVFHLLFVPSSTYKSGDAFVEQRPSLRICASRNTGRTYRLWNVIPVVSIVRRSPAGSLLVANRP